MEEEKKLNYSGKYRADRCLLAVAVSLSAVSILLAIACGFAVLSMKEKFHAYEARLVKCESHTHMQKVPDNNSKAVIQNLKIIEEDQKIGNVKNAS